jgi:hypothetical protein
MHRHSLITGLATLLLLAPLAAAGFEPNVLPELQVSRAVGEIVIDGKLDDAGWTGAARAENWSETWPGDNVEPEIGHEAWMTYDDENLYFCFIVTEDPSQVRASLRDRDEVWRDDYVGLILDTYGTGAWAYELFINPRGVQMDLRWTPNGEDMGFDVVWESEGRMTDTGWQVEVRIPFRSMRFPDNDVQEWRATFWHNRPRESRLRYSWAAGDRDNPCWPCTWGTIKGIENVSGGGSVAVLPSVTAYDARGLDDPGDPNSKFGHQDSNVEVGIGARYAISSSFAAEATINPDFSQVESDAAQIDANTTFALFFPERRPFFQEGSDLYNSYIDAIYTRSINDPQWAGKLTGRTERSSTALLVAQDELSPIVLPFEERTEITAGERSWSAIGRTRYSLGESSYVAGLGTFRALEGGGANAVYGADTMLRFFDNYQFEGQLLVSHTEESEMGDLDGALGGTFDGGRYTEALDGESFAGTAAYGSVEYHARRLDLDFDYWRIAPTFRADNGFIFQNDNQRASFVARPNWQPDNRVLDEVSVFAMIARVWNTRGERKDEWIRPELNFQFKSQTSLGLGYLTSNEVFGGQELNGIQRFDIHADTRFSEYLNANVGFEYGDFVARNASPVRLGDGRAFSAGVTIQPVARLSIEPSWRWQQLKDPATGTTDPDGFFEGSITRMRINVQFTREFFLRMIFQYNEFSDGYDFEPLLTYRINPFTVFYVGSAHRWQDYAGDFDGFGVEETDRQYFAKFQYLFHN